jgi:uncharacterized protein with HEPN domain
MTLHLDLPYLNYMLDIINDIENSLSKISKDKFLTDKDIRDANVRRIEIISETIKNLSINIKNKHNNVNWDKFVSIKESISNHYFGINFGIIFDLLKDDVPILKKQIKKIKKEI